RRANVVAPGKARDRRSEPAIKSDDSVKAFRNGRKTRNMIVTPRQPTSQRSKDGFSAEKDTAVGLDINQRALKLFARNFWKPFGAFLGCRVIDRVARDLTPALDPSPAEMAFAVPDNERLRRRIGDAR